VGKVTVIIESKNVPTDTLYDAMKRCMPSEDRIRLFCTDNLSFVRDQDVRVYIVPSDEEE
jgi:hypothetical protein